VDEEIGVKFFDFVVKKWQREMEGLIEGCACIGALLLKIISKSFSFFQYEEKKKFNHQIYYNTQP
jgi:hypothetical protein